MPQVYQGAQFAGYPALQGPAATSDYQLVGFTWTFPDGAVKGYGQFSQAQEAAPPVGPGAPYSWFSGGPRVSSAQSPDDFPFTADDLTWTSGTDDHAVDSFYWGPKAEGSNIVKISATYNKVVDGVVVDTFQGTDTDSFNVIQTTGNISILPGKFGFAGLSDTDDTAANGMGQFWIGFDKNAHTANPTTGRPVGIQYSASISAPSVGSFTCIQTIKYQETRSWTDTKGVFRKEQTGFYVDPSTGVRITNSDGSPKSMATAPALDGNGGLGYGFRVNDPLLPPASPTPNPMPTSTTVSGPNGPNTLYGNDSPGKALSPGLPMTGWQGGTWTLADSFVITLMFNPNPVANSSGSTEGPSGSIWVPVGQLTWSFSASAGYYTFSNPAPKWVPGPSSQASGTYTTTTTFPTWSAWKDDPGMSAGFGTFFLVP